MSVISKNLSSLAAGAVHRGVIGAVVGAICRTKVKETALLFATMSLGREILLKSVNQLMGVERDDVSNKVLAADLAIKSLNATILIMALRSLGVISTKGTIFFGVVEGFVITYTIFRDPITQMLNELGWKDLSKGIHKGLNPTVSWTN